MQNTWRKLSITMSLYKAIFYHDNKTLPSMSNMSNFCYSTVLSCLKTVGINRQSFMHPFANIYQMISIKCIQYNYTVRLKRVKIVILIMVHTASVRGAIVIIHRTICLQLMLHCALMQL